MSRRDRKKAAGHGGGAAPSSRELVCRTCGVKLSVAAGTKVVRCEYCATDNVVPPELRELLETPRPPPQPPGPFPVVPQPPAPAPRPLAPPPPRKGISTGSKVLIAVFVVIFFMPFLVVLATVLLPLLLVPLALFFGTKAAPPPAVTREPPPAVRTVDEGPALRFVDAGCVVPSFERADPLRTLDNLAAKVRAKWNGGARPGWALFKKVASDGTVDLLHPGEGVVVVNFYAPGGEGGGKKGGGGAPPAAKLDVYVMNGTLSETEALPPDAAAGAPLLLTKAPSCDTATLWRKAIQAGYPPSAAADIELPLLPYGLTVKERKREKAFLSYKFTIPGLDAQSRPRFFRLSDCTAR